MPMSVWLVDDRSEMLELLVEFIDRGGTLRCARQFHSAEAVLAALGRERAPDIILMDVNMHGMTGLDAIQPIKRLARSTRVFIMTTFCQGTSASLARRNGASGFFLKGGDWEEAIARMQDASLDWTPETATIPVQWDGQGAEREAVVRVCSESPNLSAKRTSKPPAVSHRWSGPPFLARALKMVRSLFAQPSRRPPPSATRPTEERVVFEGPV
ncbi:hypothetical protein SBV1_2450017 [Verrucomicrobia bacterium]|nr:hypothetical protein SBV1_2450017 [Verrucomicrobiota bacterium]